MTTSVLKPKWHTIPEVAELLGFGLSKTKTLILQRKIRSIKVGHHRRVMPEWVDDFIQRTIAEGEDL